MKKYRIWICIVNFTLSNRISSDVPAPPTSVTSRDVFHDSCVLSWLPPTIDGGAPITGYFIEMRPGRSSMWTRLNLHPVSDTQYRARDLIDGNTYEFRILAENTAGVSEPSAPTPSFIAKDPWDKPGPPGVPELSDITKRSCNLRWTPPVRDGGDEVSNYVVEYRETGTFKWARANIGEKTPDARYKVTGLHRGREYEFRVAAANRAGVGAFSDASLPITTEDPTGAFSFLDRLLIRVNRTAYALCKTVG